MLRRINLYYLGHVFGACTACSSSDAPSVGSRDGYYLHTHAREATQGLHPVYILCTVAQESGSRGNILLSSTSPEPARSSLSLTTSFPRLPIITLDALIPLTVYNWSRRRRAPFRTCACGRAPARIFECNVADCGCLRRPPPRYCTNSGHRRAT